MSPNLNIEFEAGVRLLTKYFPVSDENSRKPVLFHDIRVGVYLYENNYSREIVLAGLLHDALEFSDLTVEALRLEFGEEVMKIVTACSKDDSIDDKNKKTADLIKRCVVVGEPALIVKVADILDSFKYYSSVNNQEQLSYCQRNAAAIFRYKLENFDDKIFMELKSWYDRYLNLAE